MTYIGQKPSYSAVYDTFFVTNLYIKMLRASGYNLKTKLKHQAKTLNDEQATREL